MKKILSLILLIPLLAFDDGESYLQKVASYTKDSYFKEEVYKEKDWKAFYKMPEANAAVDPKTYDMHLLSAAFFYATNKLRQEKRLPVFSYLPALRDAAVLHTNEMIERNFFDHYNTRNRKYYSPDKRMKLFGVESDAGAENCDFNYLELNKGITYIQLAEEIVKDLYKSPPHKKNMMNKAYTKMGCAVLFEKKEKDGAWYCKATQDFSAN
ncbi:MAG: CAP domain-containing protein [Chitinophagales bacterium]